MSFQIYIILLILATVLYGISWYRNGGDKVAYTDESNYVYYGAVLSQVVGLGLLWRNGHMMI